jgi:hypothetical protein
MGSTRKEKIAKIAEIGKECSGRRELVSFLEGKSITRVQAIKALCYECMGYYSDGRECCGCTECPLFPFTPYSTDKSQAKTRTITPEQKESSRKRMNQMHKDGKFDKA